MARSTALILIALAAAHGCQRASAAGQPPGASLRQGNHTFTLRHDGRSRSYIVHVPPRPSSPAPVLLAFHGGGGNARGFEQYAELDRVADSAGFLVVYPDGTGLLRRRLLTWNAGDDCCGYALDHKVDDVGFAVAVIDDLAGRTPVDRHRIYATGHSNGAIFAHRLAAERSDLIAAIAPVAGALDLAHFAPARSVPVLQIHSVDDPRALYDGGVGPPFPGTSRRVHHQPVQAGIDRWIAADGCPTRADTVAVHHGAPGSSNAGQTATKLVWGPCHGGAEVALWKLTGAGHGWPGDHTSGLAERLIGPPTNLIHAADEIWAFVSRFSR
jgi:polyhydroxybutyrate depolymerase